jgi:hypothetical protein
LVSVLLTHILILFVLSFFLFLHSFFLSLFSFCFFLSLFLNSVPFFLFHHFDLIFTSFFLFCLFFVPASFFFMTEVAPAALEPFHWASCCPGDPALDRMTQKHPPFPPTDIWTFAELTHGHLFLTG